MSWSVNYIGSPENIVKALEANSEVLSGKSKEEYDDALPHIKALVSQNHSTSYPVTLKISANGHGYDGYNNCSVTIENSGTILV